MLWSLHENKYEWLVLIQIQNIKNTDQFIYLIMTDIKYGIAGGMAGIAVDVVFYPLETLKTRIMATSAK